MLPHPHQILPDESKALHASWFLDLATIGFLKDLNVNEEIKLIPLMGGGREPMSSSNHEWPKMTFMIFSILILIGLCGCSQEVKKERHWKRGEKCFPENKFREAIIEHKNVIQIDPQNANAH